MFANLGNDLLNGIFSSLAAKVIAAIVIAFLGALCRIMLPNLWNKFRYKGQDISGKWIAKFRIGEEKGKEEIKIRQYGSKIRGKITTILKCPDGKEKYLVSKIYGEFRNDFLVAYYVPKSYKNFGCGSLTMKLLDNGNRFEGQCTYQYSKNRELRLLEYKWVRPKGK